LRKPRLDLRLLLLLACALMLVAAVGAQAGSARTARIGAGVARARAAEHFACSTPTSAHRPCYFSTPSGDVRCVWTPSPNSVTCELLASRRAYRLHPRGHAKAVRVALSRRGETLPANQILTFPEQLSCRASKTAMTCNQDEGFGEFKLSPHSSHAA
jgi:hypothetical protein